jgi:hypothetical protein
LLGELLGKRCRRNGFAIDIPAGLLHNIRVKSWVNCKGRINRFKQTGRRSKLSRGNKTSERIVGIEIGRSAIGRSATSGLATSRRYEIINDIGLGIKTQTRNRGVCATRRSQGAGESSIGNSPSLGR